MSQLDFEKRISSSNNLYPDYLGPFLVLLSLRMILDFQ